MFCLPKILHNKPESMIYKPEAIPYVLKINLILCHYFMAKGQHKYFYYAMVVDFQNIVCNKISIFCNREVRYFTLNVK